MNYAKILKGGAGSGRHSDGTSNVAAMTNEYHQQLKVFTALHNTVHQPYFNATKDKSILDAYNKKREDVKLLADKLWEQGVNVHH